LSISFHSGIFAAEAGRESARNTIESAANRAKAKVRVMAAL
jgi:hypothetical protein